MFFNKKHKKHENVGRVFRSPFFDKNIVVVEYRNRRHWYFKFLTDDFKEKGSRYRAQTDFEYFLKNALERDNTPYIKPGSQNEKGSE